MTRLVMTCGAQYTGCDCWCHANAKRNECACYGQVKTPEVAVEKQDKGRDGRPLPEGYLESYLDRKVRTLGGKVIKIAPLEKGNPDRLVMMPFGRMYLVEMKTFVGTPSPAQMVWHSRSRDRGHVVHIINTKEKIDNFIRWAVQTGTGLANGKRQASKDWDAMVNGYVDEEDN
jgi:hypothetical protein